MECKGVNFQETYTLKLYKVKINFFFMRKIEFFYIKVDNYRIDYYSLNIQNFPNIISEFCKILLQAKTSWIFYKKYHKNTENIDNIILTKVGIFCSFVISPYYRILQLYSWALFWKNFTRLKLFGKKMEQLNLE